MVHSDVRRSPRTAGTQQSPGLGLKSPIAKVKKTSSTPGKASPSPARRLAVAQALRGESTPQQGPSASSTPRVGSAKNYKEEEPLTVRLNVYDLVWNRHDESETAKNAASGSAVRASICMLACRSRSHANPAVPHHAACIDGLFRGQALRTLASVSITPRSKSGARRSASDIASATSRGSLP
jgi:hypothetical protein